MNPHPDWLPGQPLPEAFTALPYQIYKDDPYWIPEPAAELETAFSTANPWFEGRQAAAWTVPGKGRMAGFFDPALRIKGEPVAYFGYWEALPEMSACRELFARFEGWAAACGAARVYGPVNFNTFGKYRIRMNLQPGEGCFPGEPYNPVYYKDLLTACDYQPEMSYISQYIPDAEIDRVYGAKEGLKGAIARLPYKFRNLTADFWLERLPQFYGAVDLIFGHNFAYTPISWEEFQRIYGPGFAQKLCPKLSVVVLDDAQEIIGFSLGFPDYAPLCNQGAASPIPYADISYETHFSLLQSPTFLLRTIGVMPEYRRQDVMNAMAIFAMSQFRKYYKRTMACLMKADNFSTYFFREFNLVRREYSLFTKAISQ